MNRTYTVDLTAPLAFDAVWTLAIALKRTIGIIYAVMNLEQVM